MNNELKNAKNDLKEQLKQLTQSSGPVLNCTRLKATLNKIKQLEIKKGSNGGGVSIVDITNIPENLVNLFYLIEKIKQIKSYDTNLQTYQSNALQLINKMTAVELGTKYDNETALIYAIKDKSLYLTEIQEALILKMTQADLGKNDTS